MIKTIISIASVATIMMSCSGKGDYTCECTETYSSLKGTTTTPSTSTTTTKTVYVDQYKKSAQQNCASITSTRTEVDSKGIDKDPVDSDIRTTTCKLTSN